MREPSLPRVPLNRDIVIRESLSSVSEPPKSLPPFLARRLASLHGSLRPSDPSQLRSLRPIATSVSPQQTSVVPAEDASLDRPTRGRRGIAMVLLATALVAGGAGLWRSHRMVATRETTAHVVSGRAGLRATQTGAHERWSAPLTLTLDASLDQIDPHAKDAVTAALATWEAAGAGVPAVNVTSDGAAGQAMQDGVSRVLFAPITIPGHETDVAVTIGYADTASGELREADIILNSAYPFIVIDPPPQSGSTDPGGGNQGNGNQNNGNQNKSGNQDNGNQNNGNQNNGGDQGNSGNQGAAGDQGSGGDQGSSSGNDNGDMNKNSGRRFGKKHADDGPKTAGDTSGDGQGATAAIACATQYDVQNIATHEAGHLFGLGEDVDDHAATMFLRSAPCETHKRALTPSDQSVMASLYAEPAPSKSGGAAVGCGGAQIASGHTTRGGLWIVSAAIALFAARRKRGRRIP
jgi:hypothetical protein